MEKQNQDNAIRYQIVIADDHALVRGGLELVVKMAVPNSDIFQTNSFDETLKVLSDKPSIDLLLLDLMMPGMDSEKSIQNITNNYPGVPIVIVSVKEDFDSIHMAISSGSSGYIPKTSLPTITSLIVEFDISKLIIVFIFFIFEERLLVDFLFIL